MRFFYIVGPARTGAGLVAGMLYEGGLYMGAHVMLPTPENPKGAFGDMCLSNISRRLLWLLGWDYLHPPARTGNFAVLQNVLAGYLYCGRRQAIARRVDAWGTKTVEGCQLWPVYEDVLHDLKAHVIVTLRDADATAHSLNLAYPDMYPTLEKAQTRHRTDMWCLSPFLTRWDGSLLRVKFERWFNEEQDAQFAELEEFVGMTVDRAHLDPGARHF